MDDKGLNQEELEKLAQEAVKANEEKAQAEGNKSPISRLVIEFVGPGNASFKNVQMELVTPDQMAGAGMQLLTQAMSIWNIGFTQQIVSQTVAEIFEQQKRAAQEEQVRRALSGRGERPS